MTRAGRVALVAIKLAIASALVWWLLARGHLDLQAYGRLFTGPHRWLLAAALMLQAASMAVFISRWHGLVQAQGIAISWADVFRTGLQGLFTQLFVPGGLGTDGLRLLHLQRVTRGNLAAGLSTVLMDRVVGVASLFVAAALAGLAHAALSSNPVMLPIVAVSVVVLALASVAWRLSGLLPRLPAPRRLRDALGAVVDALRSYGDHKAALATAMLTSIAGHLLTAAAAYCCLLSLDAQDPSFMAVAAINSVLNLIRMVPITPMGLGVTDLAGEGLFQLIGLSLGAELQMLLRVISVLVFVLAGAAFFWRASEDRAG